MAYPTKIGGETEPNCIKKGNLWLGVGGRNYGPTNQTGFYATLPPPEDGYVVLMEKSSGGPAVYSCANDSDLIGAINGAEAQSFSTLEQVLNYAAENDIAVVNKIEPEIVTDGLVFNVDASSLLSYPTTESKWYDLSGENNDGALTNGPIFNPVGYFEFDGVDDYVSFSQITFDDTTFTTEALIKITDFDDRRIIFGGSRFFEFTSAGTILMKFNADGTSTFINLGGHPSSSTLNKTFLHHLVKKPGNVYESYVNGELVITKTPPFTAYPEIDITSNTSIEHYYTSLGNNGSRDFYGNFYSAKVYNRNLSQSEILQNYYGGPIITDSLDLVYDAGNLVSYESGSLTTYPMTGSITGTLINGAGFSTDGGGSFDFDGTDDVIDLDYTNVMYNTSTMTLECWIKSSDNGAGSEYWCTFMGTRYGNSIQIGRYGGDNKCGVLIATSTNGNLNLASGTTPIFDEKWHHCVVTFDNGVCKFYVDTNLEVTDSSRSGQTLTTSNSDKFGIGGSSGGGDQRNFYGKITSCKIYSKALTSEEVQQNYLAQWGRFT